MTLVAWMMGAAATPYDEATRLFESGKYLKAASLAATTDTASGLALSARATLTHVMFVADRSQTTAEVQRAVDFARNALALDPAHVEAHLQLVIALHQQARAVTPFSAYLQGYAAEARHHLDAALSLDPDNPWVHSLLGGWHYEIVRLAGSTLGGLLFEADLEKGRAAFAKAVALMPNSIVLRYEFARALLLSDPDTNRGKAMDALKVVFAETPVSHLEKLMSDRARAALDAMTSGSLEQLQRILDPDR